MTGADRCLGSSGGDGSGRPGRRPVPDAAPAGGSGCRLRVAGAPDRPDRGGRRRPDGAVGRGGGGRRRVRTGTVSAPAGSDPARAAPGRHRRQHRDAACRRAAAGRGRFRRRPAPAHRVGGCGAGDAHALPPAAAGGRPGGAPPGAATGRSAAGEHERRHGRRALAAVPRRRAGPAPGQRALVTRRRNRRAAGGRLRRRPRAGLRLRPRHSRSRAGSRLLRQLPVRRLDRTRMAAGPEERRRGGRILDRAARIGALPRPGRCPDCEGLWTIDR